MKISNPTKGAKGVWDGTQTIWIEPGQTVEVEGVTDAEMKSAEGQGLKKGGLKDDEAQAAVSGAAVEPARVGRPPNAR